MATSSSTEHRAAELQPGAGMTPAVRWLLAINVAVYFVQLALFGTEAMTTWLGLSPTGFPDHWWTAVTYMFVHAGFAHLATNMIVLWIFGPRLENAFGTRSFVYFYFWCGLGGAIMQLLFVHSPGFVIGASGAVVGVVLAYGLRWPDDEVYLLGIFAMRARWLAIGTVVWNVGMALADVTGYTNSSTAWVTHVGGLAFAWLFLHAPTSSTLERIRRHVSTVPDDPNPNPIPRVQRPRRQEPDGPPSADDAVARSNALVKRRPTPVILPPAAMPPAADVDALLDKISREGMASLTPAERRLLEEVSRRLRDGGA